MTNLGLIAEFSAAGAWFRWFLKFGRPGLAYNFSDGSELRGIKLVFRSLYEL